MRIKENIDKVNLANHHYSGKVRWELNEVSHLPLRMAVAGFAMTTIIVLLSAPLPLPPWARLWAGPWSIPFWGVPVATLCYFAGRDFESKD